MRRLYVGGLGHSVTRKDLEERFGRFGAVEEVELRTRRGGDGVPHRTFAYVNIDVSDAELKRCLTVLNKSRWKGGTLRIEDARQSVLHRLAEERREEAERREAEPRPLLDSLSRVGVADFTMKAAVPGTEVPGHKGWVVSKFGRVLPVMQLRRRAGGKPRPLRYDPSRYGHNIRRLDRAPEAPPTPVTQLTWAVEGGDDDISKKRRGEFPRYDPPRPERVGEAVPAGAGPRTNGTGPPRRGAGPGPDSDSDREMAAARQTSHDAVQQEEEQLQVVGVDFPAKSPHGGDEEDGYDTDELLASRRRGEEQPGVADQGEGQLQWAGPCSHYDVMFSGATRLEVSLEDLQRLVQHAAAPSMLCSRPQRPAPKRATTPEEILAALLQEDSGDEEAPKKRRRNVTAAALPVFQGTSSLQEAREEEREEEQPKKTTDVTPDSSSCTSSTEEEEDSERAAPPLQQRRSSSKEEEEAPPLPPPPPPRQPLASEEEEQLQRRANLRRLAALQQRREEAQEHRKLIQGALCTLDAPGPRGGKHVVFASDDEDEQPLPLGQSEEALGGRGGARGWTVRPTRSIPQLFGGSEDEEEADEDEDGGRFSIRPQFEGREGQKLMDLQARFGTDERFRMDSRFLEEQEEAESDTRRSPAEEVEALEEEKKKNLSILHSVLGSSRPARTAAKKFRDAAALHYDPSREEHAAFETQTEDTSPLSKSARRKRRDEEQRLPDVPRDIYYDVPGDLKATFGPARDSVPAGVGDWDQKEDGGAEEEPALLSAEPGPKEEESGFRFSFFGDGPEPAGGEPARYQVEKLRTPKVRDPRFQDSSSEEEQEEQQEEELSSAAEEKTAAPAGAFFFGPDDRRLEDGPRWFCGSGRLEEEREQWEERRSELRREFRKKHKDARRRLAASSRS